MESIHVCFSAVNGHAGANYRCALPVWMPECHSYARCGQWRKSLFDSEIVGGGCNQRASLNVFICGAGFRVPFSACAQVARFAPRLILSTRVGRARGIKERRCAVMAEETPVTSVGGVQYRVTPEYLANASADAAKTAND